MTRSQHLLLCLAEESSEVIKAVTKSLRFGLHGSHPGYADGRTNIQELRHELHDLMALIEMVHDDVGELLPLDYALIDAKKMKVLKFVQHAKVNGEID